MRRIQRLLVLIDQFSFCFEVSIQNVQQVPPYVLFYVSVSMKTILRKLRMHNHRQNNLATTGEKHDVMSSTPFCCQVFSRV